MIKELLRAMANTKYKTKGMAMYYYGTKAEAEAFIEKLKQCVKLNTKGAE